MSDTLFEAAVKFISNGTGFTATDEDKLSFYKYFKQATIGDCNIAKPGFFQLQQKYKWEAWDSVRGMAQEAAKAAYVALLDKLCPSWRN
ncbi:acyl CoA binding protein, putative [Babesia bigemina]|uniref:Acyl CoA binding protein, putative n=1 Tax=Babesia bigemina TaxID=5866 RepID=A0A061DBF3_BABBI|nr:acyl CoA binding protein, putative [Babesia bigemina]CDR97863.1 acyl CoA binding protein, putative [Babesia bigemina]|eukprot:XP_012770049.1 acyl CoA binding protein, putative [Babesia bigemina]